MPHIFQLTSRFLPEGVGVLPIMAYTRRLPPKGVSFSGFRFMKGKEICHLGLWKDPKGRADEFYGFITLGNVLFF